ncbi:hypothetical protein C2S53_015838 [Perilla frutescens var. hirtella]|uniref:Cytochrome P450 n=1 Tax=Perilla frutescens var. hirtella TaxID=608512 RepID=A0AAD4JN93_PERFH|nr:hypothetical protein C2S53_015838 [Perilla frutescens var. hirtella]
MEKHILVQIIASLAVAVVVGLTLRLYSAVVATPRRLRHVLKQQGVGGPPPAFLLGNIMEIKNSQVISAAAATTGPPDSDNCGANCVASVFDEWRRQYGDIYTFSLGNKPVLVVNNYDVLKEVTKCISLDLGKPLYQAKDLEALLGNGILPSNGKLWAHQRKIIAPELFIDKVKGMTNLIQQSTMMLIDSWQGVIDAEGGIKADIKIDDYLKKFSGEVISRACFGSSYAEGEQLFKKFAALQQLTANKGVLLGIPAMRYVPTKQNRREWEVKRDVKELILKLVKQKSEENLEKNMLQMILQGAESSNLSSDAVEKFIVDNCKNIYIAGFETTAITASWCLMLLASNPEWQHRLREEVLGVCNGQLPDFGSIKQMKQLAMVINETLRLYPPAWVVSREALNELEFNNIRIPKGVCIWMMVVSLHTDPEIWGADSYQFKPERFANGTIGACKHPNLYMPFGVGPRTCLGMNLAMVELKILVALLLSNFSFSLSPNYVHAPALNVNVQPAHGVHLLIQRSHA